jgi:hypothetical protein
MPDYPPQMPHGPLDEIFNDIFFVTGTARPTFDGVEYQFSRNMTVVREGTALTLINSVRLDDAGLAALEALGNVEHVVKLSSNHGLDDRFYVDRYKAAQWALPGDEHGGGQSIDRELSDSALPFADASLFVFETAKLPEALLCIDREGGIVVAADSLQNWAEPDRFFSDETAKGMTAMGFIKPANIGPGWRRAAEPQAQDFARLLGLDFDHLLPGHGTPLRKQAKAELRKTFEREFEMPR